MKPLIVIPVRGASQGIPRKALLPLGGIPPLIRTIQSVRDLGDVIVTTDDGEIAALASSQGIEVFHESAAINPGGRRTVDTAVWQVVSQKPHELVATVQCTSPFLTPRTVEACLYLAYVGDSAITVRDDRHVAWMGSLDNPILATPWAVRQSLPPRWVLTGGCVAARRAVMGPDHRFGGDLKLVEISGAEALDLDEPKDWALAEWYSGAPSLRETLMARVMSDWYPLDCFAVKFSSWDEETDDATFRNALLERFTAGVTMPLGRHTYDEAVATGTLIEVAACSDVVLLTSAYHQLRAFLTMLRVLQQTSLDRTVRLWNAPAASRMDKLPLEWQKIRDYQAKGHVATLEDGLAYLEWRDSKVTCVT